MKKILLVLSSGLLFACNDTSKDSVNSAGGTVKDSSAKADDATYPYTAGYSSKFEIGSSKDAQTILAIWKDFDNGTLANSKDKFADSVKFYFADGTSFSGTRDSAISMGQKYRDSYSALSTTVDAWVPLKATDKNENWVAIWGLEKHTGKDGKVDSVHLHEVWRLNSAGKADLVYQFAVQPPPMKNK